MKKVLLTGISGFVGHHCAVELLKQGYTVKGSIRNLKKSEQITKNIEEQVDPAGRLEFCELNLMQDEGWTEAMEGCDFVLHVASPFVSKEPKDENELIKPAVEGTLRALKAAKKAGVKRVVLTSSMVAMLGDLKGDANVNSDSWTNTNAKKITAYLKSKTLAEKSAWDFIDKQEDENKLELTVINPGPIFGPTLANKISGESMELFQNLITGKVPMMPKSSINISDVRDIAKIHVLAMENKDANGKRFIVATENTHSYHEIAEILKTNGYEKAKPSKAPNFLINILANVNDELRGMLPYVGNIYKADLTTTMKTFNWSPIPLEETVLDTAKSVRDIMDN
jgi:dihydroflavonol-4-reductase